MLRARDSHFFSTKEREQFKETLAAAAKRALQDFQADISEKHDLLVVARQIAVIDCLMSFAQVAAASGYCKPQFVAEPSLHIRSGRHPMVSPVRKWYKNHADKISGGDAAR